MKSIIATLATLCVVSSYIPQIVKGLKTKSLRDVSLIFLIVIILGTLLWIFYGFLNQDYIFLLANSVILIFAICLTIMKIMYERKRPV
ncbi:MAG: SemiSWEET family transporter [Candidatus Doudnabacteria bacterium]|nr:SemiSWEET family transporter [Candidatus Doudnabacteria bacterium]